MTIPFFRVVDCDNLPKGVFYPPIIHIKEVSFEMWTWKLCVGVLTYSTHLTQWKSVKTLTKPRGVNVQPKPGNIGKWVFPKIVDFPRKSSILIGFSIVNHPFWGTLIFGSTQMIWWFRGPARTGASTYRFVFTDSLSRLRWHTRVWVGQHMLSCRSSIGVRTNPNIRSMGPTRAGSM